jgi:hypothetical protein
MRGAYPHLLPSSTPPSLLVRSWHTVVYEIFKRVMNTGVSITGALIALLLAIIGYLLVNPVGLQ